MTGTTPDDTVFGPDTPGKWRDFVQQLPKRTPAERRIRKTRGADEPPDVGNEMFGNQGDAS